MGELFLYPDHLTPPMKHPIRLVLVFCWTQMVHPSSGQDSAFTFSGYIDIYYGYDFTRPNVGNGFTSRSQRPYVTQYDQHNAFAVNHAILSAKYSRQKVDAEMAVQTGSFPITNYAHEPSVLYRMIHRARVGYQLFKSGRIDAGIMGGHFGYESVLTMERELLSPALATEYTPYYQTGIQYSHSLSASTDLRVVVVNGWQTIAENDDSKAVGLGIDQKIGAISVSYGNFFGRQGDPFNQDLSWERFHHNLILSYKKGVFGLISIGDFTHQRWFSPDPAVEDGNVIFLTGIGSWQAGDNLSVAGRYEYVRDSQQILIKTYQSVPLNLQVVSLCLDYRPDEIISFKLEPKRYLGRRDYFHGHGEDSDRCFVICASLAVMMQ